MSKSTFRSLAPLGILMICLSASAQVSTRTPSAAQRINPATQRINPATQRIDPANQRINPAMNRIMPPSQPATVYPVTPTTIIPPAIPSPGVIITSPGYVFPGTSVYTPIVPSYPSAWIGPTIIHETHSEPAPGLAPVNPAATNAPMPTLRLVAVLGALRRFDAATGADLGLAEIPLAVSVGVLAGNSQDKSVRASGDFFGTCWDGPGSFAKNEDAMQGPFLDHPIMTLNEFSPSPWEFEVGAANRRIGWARVALTLFEDTSQRSVVRPVNFPRGRRAAMREVLNRVPWADKGVARSTPGVDEPTALAGGDITYFGKALATFAEKTMAPAPDNERIGVAEWYLSVQQLGKAVAACPRFVAEPVDGAQIRAARAAAGNTVPTWVRECEFRTDRESYLAELWFIVVPDAAMNAWLQRK